MNPLWNTVVIGGFYNGERWRLLLLNTMYSGSLLSVRSSCLSLIFNQSAILLSSSFLGYVDKLGVAYEAPTVATGFGAYLAQVSEFVLLLLVCSWTLCSAQSPTWPTEMWFKYVAHSQLLTRNLTAEILLEKMSHSVGVRVELLPSQRIFCQVQTQSDEFHVFLSSRFSLNEH